MGGRLSPRPRCGRLHIGLVPLLVRRPQPDTTGAARPGHVSARRGALRSRGRDTTEASAFALAACDPEATSAEQAVVRAGPNAQKPKSAHGIVKSRPTKEQRDRIERNRLAALDRLAATRASRP